MHVGLYFGSFNPIHIGHLLIGSYVANNSVVDQVWFVVSPQNPLKKSATLLNEYHRLHLVQLAIAKDPQLKCSDIEFKLPRPSYTIDTLTYLQEKYPTYTFSIIMGTDSLQNIDKWKNGHLILSNFTIFAYARPGFDQIKTTEKVVLLNAPLLEISSTQIREQLKKGKTIRYMVTEEVRQEIELNNYYKH